MAKNCLESNLQLTTDANDSISRLLKNASRKTLLDMSVSGRNEHDTLGSFFRTCAAPKLGDKHSKKDCPLYQGLKAYAKRQTFMRRTKLSELSS